MQHESSSQHAKFSGHLLIAKYATCQPIVFEIVYPEKWIVSNEGQHYISTSQELNPTEREDRAMKLQAVFWDYPQFLDEAYLRAFLQKNAGNQLYYWAMNRLLEHGRVIDTFAFFRPEEIAANWHKLKLSEYNQRKWHRLLEVYD